MEIKPGVVLVGILGILVHTFDGFGSLNGCCDDSPLGRADILGMATLSYVAAAGDIQECEDSIGRPYSDSATPAGRKTLSRTFSRTS